MQDRVESDGPESKQLEAGLRAAYGPRGKPGRSIVEQLGVGDSRVMLPDPPGEHTPMVNTRSETMESTPRTVGRYHAGKSWHIPLHFR